MKRNVIIKHVVRAFGSINREFNVKGNYPFKSYCLGNSHMEILFLLSQGQKSIKQLSLHLHVTSGAVTQLVDFLETKGLVVKTEDPDDKRSRLVGLSKDSTSLVAAFEQDYLQTISAKFINLSDEDLANLQRILNKIRST